MLRLVVLVIKLLLVLGENMKTSGTPSKYPKDLVVVVDEAVGAGNGSHGRHVVCGRALLAGQAQISQACLRVCVEKDVARLEVSV